MALTGYVPMGGGMSVVASQPDNTPEVPVQSAAGHELCRHRRRLFLDDGHSVVRGSEFTAQDMVVDPRVIIINDAMARRDFPNDLRSQI